MTAVDAEEALWVWDKLWRRERDIQWLIICSDGELDGCSFVDETIGCNSNSCIGKNPSHDRGCRILSHRGTYLSRQRHNTAANWEGGQLLWWWTKIVNPFQVDVCGTNGDTFHILTYYGTIALKCCYYMPALAECLEEGGDDFNIFVKTPKQVWRRLLGIVLQDQMNSLKKDDKTMMKAKKLKYVDAWETTNKEC